MTKPATIEIDREAAFKWVMNGAQPTDTVRAILRFKGVLYKKHLHQGVLKGALTEEQAEAKYNAWIDAKEARIASRFEQTKEEKAAFQQSVFGKKKEVVKPVVEEEADAETEAENTEETGSEVSAEPQVEVSAPDSEATAPEPDAPAPAEETATEEEQAEEK